MEPLFPSGETSTEKREVYSVSEITAEIKALLDGAFGFVFAGCLCRPAFLRFRRHPETEITPNPSAIGLKFLISLSSIDRCPPFRAGGRKPAF